MCPDPIDIETVPSAEKVFSDKEKKTIKKIAPSIIKLPRKKI